MKKIGKKFMVILSCITLMIAMVGCAKGEDEDMNEDYTLNSTEETKEEAHVILLAGQSNASGISWNKFLKNSVSEEKFEEYTKGYENIKICYYVDNENVSHEFIPVALGQGHTKECFGPEIGIAEYLTEHYPTEKFYIIKTTMSGSGIAAEWKDGDETYNRIVTGIENGFQKLKSDGLEPKWFATCWMQGEGDSWALENAERYYELESDLMSRLQERFGKYASDKGVSLIDAGISDYEEWKYHDMINAAKQKYALKNPQNFYLDTQEAGLTYDQDNQDFAHFDAASMLQLGRMFGDKVKEAYEFFMEE